jgi:hypothetical protein
MRAEELIGKWAYRRRGAKTEHCENNISLTLKDMLGCCPVLIDSINDKGIAVKARGSEYVWYVDRKFLDDKWAEYDPKMDKYPWDAINKGGTLPKCSDCKYTMQNDAPCTWCCGYGGVESYRNYFQPKKEEYPHTIVPTLVEVGDCSKCLFEESKIPCPKCGIQDGKGYRNYFQPKKEGEYPYFTAPEDYTPDCEICKFDETHHGEQPCCDCIGGNRCYFQPADDETIIRQAIAEIEQAQEDLAHITKIIELILEK